MGKIYKRAGEPAKKMCDSCKTVWDDKNLFNDQHQYGGESCPCCHVPWEGTETIKLPPLVVRKTARMEQKLYKLGQRLEEIDSETTKLSNTPIVNSNVRVYQGSKEHHEDFEELSARHIRDLKALTELRTERVAVMGKITEVESALAEKVTFIPEPEGIRLKNGQMDWDVAYANLRAYRDKR